MPTARELLVYATYDSDRRTDQSPPIVGRPTRSLTLRLQIPGAVLVPPGWSLVADAAALLAGHQSHPEGDVRPGGAGVLALLVDVPDPLGHRLLPRLMGRWDISCRLAAWGPHRTLWSGCFRVPATTSATWLVRSAAEVRPGVIDVYGERCPVVAAYPVARGARKCRPTLAWPEHDRGLRAGSPGLPHFQRAHGLVCLRWPDGPTSP